MEVINMLDILCKKNCSELSRRELLGGVGKVAAGITVASAGGLVIASDAEAKRQKYPWPYKKLDLKHVAHLGYENWYKNYCCYAVASGILAPLQKKIGKPYTTLPLEAFRWGHGGGVGWGTLCGTLMGAGMAAAFVAGRDGESIINDVIHYYAETELPIYVPEKPKGSFKTVNKSDSPLCHISVGRWMKKEGVKFFSPQRKERCARLSADIAVETARLLNLWADGKYKPTHKNQAKLHGMTSQDNCTDCHSGK
jgi:hypothetical protein